MYIIDITYYVCIFAQVCTTVLKYLYAESILMFMIEYCANCDRGHA